MKCSRRSKTREHIIFRNGVLNVYLKTKSDTYKSLLSLYHPQRDKIYYEFEPQVRVAKE